MLVCRSSRDSRFRLLKLRREHYGNETTTIHWNNKLLLGIVLGVITFWLFAQSLLNLVPTIQHSFSSSIGTTSIAISITALFSGMFVVGAGSFADKLGRVK